MALHAALIERNVVSSKDGTLSVAFENELPPPTARMLDSQLREFREDLIFRAHRNMRQRRSETLTDADLRCAYDDLTCPEGVSAFARGFGDSVIYAAGIITPLWSVTPILTFAGIAMMLAGLYIRERPD